MSELTKEQALLNIRAFLGESLYVWESKYTADDRAEFNSSFKMLSKKELISVIDEIFRPH